VLFVDVFVFFVFLLLVVLDYKPIFSECMAAVKMSSTKKKKKSAEKKE